MQEQHQIHFSLLAEGNDKFSIAWKNYEFNQKGRHNVSPYEKINSIYLPIQPYRPGQEFHKRR